MISAFDILRGRDAAAPLDATQKQNLAKLLLALNKFFTKCPLRRAVTSGYRPPAINAAAGGAKKSNHMACLACDFEDKDGELDKWCLANLSVLEECGLYLESPDHTPGWTHLQAVPPKSGNRVFIP